MTDNREHIAWLAGIFEVGGSVTVSRRGRRSYASVQFEGDPALVRRVCHLAGSGSTSGKSTRLRWTSTGVGALEFLAAILPHVYSSVRRERIEKAITASLTREKISK